MSMIDQHSIIRIIEREYRTNRAETRKKWRRKKSDIQLSLNLRKKGGKDYISFSILSPNKNVLDLDHRRHYCHCRFLELPLLHGILLVCLRRKTERCPFLPSSTPIPSVKELDELYILYVFCSPHFLICSRILGTSISRVTTSTTPRPSITSSIWSRRYVPPRSVIGIVRHRRRRRCCLWKHLLWYMHSRLRYEYGHCLYFIL